MAVDTAAKRFSMMSQFTGIQLVPPDGTVDQEDRQTFMDLYGGIPAAMLTSGKGVINCGWQWDYYDTD